MPTSDLIIVPDIHAGYDLGRPDALVGPIQARRDALSTPAGLPTLVFLGDVLDLWRATPTDTLRAAAPVLDLMQDHLDAGGGVDWILGNHDHHLEREIRGTSPPDVLPQLPDGIRFFHRYAEYAHAGKRIVCAHGDDADFLYIPLVQLNAGLSLFGYPLAPRDVYGFYDFVYQMNKGAVAALEKRDWRQFLVEFLLSDFAGARALTTLASGENAGHPLASLLVGGSTDIPLPEVAGRVTTALGFDIPSFAPFKKRRATAAFGGWDHLVVGHFHRPRQPDGSRVTDAGSWVEAPGFAWGTHVEVTGGSVTLWQYPNVLAARKL